MLLNSVPSPIQLKCTVDNSANEFYRTCGFKHVTTEQGKKRFLNVWKRRYLYIICRGNFSLINSLPIYAAGFEYGTRHSETPMYQPFMVDIDWENYDWNDYLHKISLWKPTFALVPDYEHPSQRRALYSHIRDLKHLSILRIGVCPKFVGAVNHIPPFCILCISVPSTYAGFLPLHEEVVGKQLHLLGGSPQKQLQCISLYSNATTISLDGISFTKAARFKAIYLSHCNKWKKMAYLPGVYYSYKTALELSLYNIAHQFYQNQEY